jgi:hypothetical protein
MKALFRFICACLIIFKKTIHIRFVSTYLEWYAHCLILKCNEDKGFCQSMRVFVGNQTPTGEMIIQKCVSLIKEYIASKPTNYELGVVIHANFGDKTGNAYFHTDHPHWNSTFQYVWIQMFPPESELQTIRKTVVDQKEIEELRDELDKVKFLNSMNKKGNIPTDEIFPQPFVPTRHKRSLFDTSVIIVHKSVVPELMQADQPEDENLEIVEVPIEPEPGDDATDLILADVKEDLESCVADAVALAAKSFDAGNRSTMMAITGNELDAQVLATEVTRAANERALEATADAIAALEVVEAVKAAADAGESVQPDIPSSEFAPGDSEAASLFLEIANKSPPQFHANGSSGPLSVIPEENEDGADQSGTSSPLPDGERQAPFTAFAQSPMQGVEDRASGAQPPFSLADSLDSTDVSKPSSSNLGSNFSSGQSGTSLTHKSSLLLAASMPSSSKSSFTHDAVTSADGGNQVQLSGVKPGFVLDPPNLLALLDEPPPLPSRSSPMGGNIGGGGAQSSGNPIGNPPGNAYPTVGVGRNPPADLLHPVQVLARSENPSGDSGGEDHLKTPSSSKLGSDSSKIGTSFSASLPPPNLFGTNGKPVRPPPPTPVPKGTDIGGSPPAHSPGDPLGFVPSPAPSLNQQLGSAATPALSPYSCPLGHDIGGTKRSGKMLDIAMVLILGAHLLHLGVPLAQAPLFSHIPPKLLAQAVEVA